MNNKYGPRQAWHVTMSHLLSHKGNTSTRILIFSAHYSCDQGLRSFCQTIVVLSRLQRENIKQPGMVGILGYKVRLIVNMVNIHV